MYIYTFIRIPRNGSEEKILVAAVGFEPTPPKRLVP